MTRVLLAWSSGKDSAWALHLLRQQPGTEVAALFTTFDRATGRVAMHGVPRTVVQAQADRVGLPLWSMDLPWPCPNTVYEQALASIFERALAQGFDAVAFGDLFLEDIRAYRVGQMQGTGLKPLFPLWHRPTGPLALEMIDAGLRARIVCVDPRRLASAFAGRLFDRALLASLPPEVDPCGEHGEFHTVVEDAPFFSAPVPIHLGPPTERNGFLVSDIADATDVASHSPHRVRPAPG